VVDSGARSGQAVRVVEDEDGSGRLPRGFGELAVDHVLLATSDLAMASRSLRDRYGLRSVEGGRHPDWGTANWIVPVGGAYLELVAVVDPRVAEESPFGRWVASARAGFVVPIGWAVRTRSLDAVAARHSLDINAGSRASPSGEVLTWRLAGLEHAARASFLPFFIEWGEATPHPSRAGGEESNDSEIVRLELTGDPEELQDWLDDEDVPVSVDTGPPAVTKVVLSTSEGELSIDTAFG
jgi:hypothetical protein